jgi:soluble lytic murein transglycosylase-like protein
VISRTTWSSDVAHAAGVVGLNADLVEAIVVVESSGNPWAVNYEPRYRYLWDVAKAAPFRAMTSAEQASEIPPSDFRALAGDPDQEWVSQQTSWGLMQLMGALARELGFYGPYLPELCRVDLNLKLGCKHLSTLMRWAGGDEGKAVAAYNAGRGGWSGSAGQAYRTKVFNTRSALAPRR